MAKYCFYCGRELKSNEKCLCRDGAGHRAGAATGTASGSTASAATKPSSAGGRRSRANGANGARTGGIFSRIGSDLRRFFSGLSRPSQSARPIRSSRLQTFRDQVRILFPTFSVVLRNVSGYFMHPATKIRQESMRAKQTWSIPVILFFSVLSGFLGMLFSRSGSPLFDSLMFLILGDDVSLLYVQPVFSMIVFSALTLIFVLTMCFSFYAAARLSRRKIPFRKIVDVFSLSLFYLILLEVFLLLSISLGSRGAVSLLFIGFVLMSVTHMISFRSALSLSEDTVFLFLIFVYSLCYFMFRGFLDITSLIIASL